MKICAWFPGQRVVTPLGRIARVDGRHDEPSHVRLTYLSGDTVALPPGLLQPYCGDLVIFNDERAALRSIYESKRGRG